MRGCSLRSYGRHWLDEDDVAAVSKVLRGDWLTTGPTVEAFEAAVAKKVGARFAAACSSGTAGLHLAALAAGIGAGDVSIVPAMTFLATANATRFCGGEVIIADVDEKTGLMGASQLEEALLRSKGKNIKAVFPVHLNGQCADMESLHKLAMDHGLAVIEDACHALGSTYKTSSNETVLTGSCRHSDMSVFSFHPVKTITMGEGGLVTANDERLVERLRRLRNHGITRDAERFENRDLAFDRNGLPNPWYYEMTEIGFNYRASDIHCALGLSQLAKLDRFVAKRRNLADRYDANIAKLAPVVCPVGRMNGSHAAWHLYAVLVDFALAGTDRASVMRALAEKGVGAQVHYLPIHMQPYYRRLNKVKLPGAEAYYSCVLSLPLFMGMNDDDVDYVVDELEKAI